MQMVTGEFAKRHMKRVLLYHNQSLRLFAFTQHAVAKLSNSNQ